MTKNRRVIDKMSALQGIWLKAEEAYDDLQANSEEGPAMDDPKVRFCLGYVFGCGFGLALSTVRPDLVSGFVPIYREKGWLDEHADDGDGRPRK